MVIQFFTDLWNKTVEIYTQIKDFLIAAFSLDMKKMKPGEMREITGSEFEELYRIAGCSTE